MIKLVPNLPAKQYRTGDLNKQLYTLNGIKTRIEYTSTYAWSIYSKEELDAIAKIISANFSQGNNRCIDVAGGMGLLTKLLRDRGVDITLNDISATGDSPDSENWYIRKNQFVPVDIVSSADDVTYDKFDIVFMSWPCYQSNWDHQVLDKLESGTILFYLGQDSGGCTGSSNFHINLRQNFRKLDELSDEVNENHVPFPHERDSWYIYQKLSKPNF